MHLSKNVTQCKKEPKKPWITKGIVTSINKRDALYKKFISEKNIEKKENIHKKYKNYRNIICKLNKSSKQLHFRNFFQENIENLKKTWTGIKCLINRNGINADIPNNMMYKNSNLNSSIDIANNFNEFFCTIAEKTKKNIPNTNRAYTDFLHFF